MLELDQSYLPNEEITIDEATSNSQKREEIFKANFRQLIEYSQQNGFPDIGSLQTTGLDSCKNQAIVATLFHIGQSQPKLFFEKETIKLLEREIENGRLSKGSLSAPLREGFRRFEFCIEHKDKMYAALKSWQMDIGQVPSIKFVACDK